MQALPGEGGVYVVRAFLFYPYTDYTNYTNYTPYTRHMINPAKTTGIRIQARLISKSAARMGGANGCGIDLQAISQFFCLHRGRLGMAGIENGRLGQGENPFPDAGQQLLPVSTGVLIVSDAAPEYRVAHEGNAILRVVECGGIRRVPRRVDRPQHGRRMALQRECSAISEVFGSMYNHVFSAYCRQVQVRIREICGPVFVDIHGEVQLTLQRLDASGMIEMPVGKQDLLDCPDFALNDPGDFISLRAGIDQEAVARILVDQEIAVDFKIAPNRDLVHVHNQPSKWHPSGPQAMPCTAVSAAFASSSSTFFNTRSMDSTGSAPGMAYLFPTTK